MRFSYYRMLRGLDLSLMGEDNSNQGPEIWANLRKIILGHSEEIFFQKIPHT